MGSNTAKWLRAILVALLLGLGASGLTACNGGNDVEEAFEEIQDEAQDLKEEVEDEVDDRM